MNLLVILKCFFMSSSDLSYTSIVKYRKYFVLFLNSVAVTFNTCVIPFASIFLIWRPVAKSPINRLGATWMRSHDDL